MNPAGDLGAVCQIAGPQSTDAITRSSSRPPFTQQDSASSR